MRRRGSRPLAAVLALVLAACGAQGTSSPPGDDGPGDGEPTGRVVAVVSDLGNLGQDLMTASPTMFKPVWDEIFDYAIEQAPSGDLQGGYVETWSVSEDGLTWTFVVREGVKFHNGSTLTADDVAWTWNRHMFDPGSTTTLTQYAELVESITAEGNEVRIVTNEQLSTVPLWFAKNIGTPSGVVYPREYFEEVGAEAFHQAPVGTGPFKYVRFDGEQSAELTAFLDDDRSEWQKSRTPAYKDLVIRAIPDASTRAALLQSGEADIVPIDISQITTLTDAGYPIIEVPGGTFSVMWCLGNTLNPESPCDNQDVREALSIAINRQEIAEALYQGYAEPTAAWVPGPGGFGYPEGLEPVAYDPERARELLEGAGWGSDNPLPVQILAYEENADFPLMPTLAEALGGYFDEVGIDATITIQEWGRQENRLETVDYPGLEGNPALPVTLFMRGIDNRFHMVDRMVTEYTETGTRGEIMWNEEHPLYQEQAALLQEVLAEFDLERQEPLFEEYHRWLADHWWHIPLLSADAVFATSQRVSAWEFRVAGKSFVHNLWSVKLGDQ